MKNTVPIRKGIPIRADVSKYYSMPSNEIITGAIKKESTEKAVMIMYSHVLSLL
jgi:hypothetical protein